MLEQDRSIYKIQGLYEVNEEVKKFLYEENIKNNTSWVSLEPNLKILVPHCKVPLKTTWVPKKVGLSGDAVFVDCLKTNEPNLKKWQIYVFVAKGLKQ